MNVLDVFGDPRIFTHLCTPRTNPGPQRGEGDVTGEAADGGTVEHDGDISVGADFTHGTASRSL